METLKVYSGVKLPKGLKIFAYKETSSPKEEEIIISSTNYYHHGKCYIVEAEICDAHFCTIKSMRGSSIKNNSQVYAEKRPDISVSSFALTLIPNNVKKIGNNIYVVI